MSWYTDWFLADVAEVEMVASIVTDEEGHTFEDWPHLPMKSVGVMELKRLWAVLRSDPAQMDDVDVEPVFVADEQEGPIVSRVHPEFIAALAALHGTKFQRAASAWHSCEEMAEWELATVTEQLQEMADFANRSIREGKPVLQLSAW